MAEAALRIPDENGPSDADLTAEAGEPQEPGPGLDGGAHYSEDSLGAYLREIGRYRLLTSQGEVDLARRIEAGAEASARLASRERPAARLRASLATRERDGESAKDEMIRANLRLVVSIARRYRATGVPLLDLVQEGNIGLIRAVEKFDWRRGFKFSTYATWWIRQAIQRGIADRGRTIRLPVHVHEMLVRVRRTRAQLESRLGREPSDEEVARAARLELEKVRELRHLSETSLSLEMPVGEAGEATIGEFVADGGADEGFADVLRRIGAGELERTLGTLTEREQDILMLHFGLNGGEPLTLEDVGRRFGLTRERIRQLEAKALAKLRHPSRSGALLAQA